MGSPGPHLGGSASLYAGIHTPPTATAAGGTHPTGMHSCLNNLLVYWIIFKIQNCFVYLCG